MLYTDSEARVVEPTSESLRTVVDNVYDIIARAEEYRMRDVAGCRPVGMNERDWRLVVHAAEQRLLDEGVVFQPAPGRPGVRRRAQTSRQAESRSKRFAAAARRKMGRATQLVAAARELATDPLDVERLERLELRRQNAMVDALSAMRGAGEKRPKGL